jgi:hypothetical protein
MKIREKAQRYMATNYPDEVLHDYRVSKFHSDRELWFLTFPTSYFDDDRNGSLIILLQNEFNTDTFYCLKIPFSFFRENMGKFDIRTDGEKFDLHLSARRSNWLVCEKSSGVDFSEYEL